MTTSANRWLRSVNPAHRLKKVFARLTRRKVAKEIVARHCLGNGIEIGPGHKPYGPRERTKYLDKHTSNKDGMPDPDYVADASAIPVEDGVFDFLISSHCLEHVPNTLRTLTEWLRVVRAGGTLLLILPHGDRTFDRFRQKTSLSHHIEDFKRLGDAASDPSHFEEMKAGWMQEPDFEQQKIAYEKEWGAPVWDFEFRMRNDALHYHVWTQTEMVDVLRHLRLEILVVIDRLEERQDSFLIVARKPASA